MTEEAVLQQGCAGSTEGVPGSCRPVPPITTRQARALSPSGKPHSCPGLGSLNPASPGTSPGVAKEARVLPPLYQSWGGDQTWGGGRQGPAKWAVLFMQPEVEIRVPREACQAFPAPGLAGWDADQNHRGYYLISHPSSWNILPSSSVLFPLARHPTPAQVASPQGTSFPAGSDALSTCFQTRG